MSTKNTKIALALTAATAVGIFAWSWLQQSKKDSKYDVVFVLGGPGSGKGTNCSKIEFHLLDYSIHNISRAVFKHIKRPSAIIH